jgi:predicted RNA-binding Zn-ribbon protein involved in translation (DUF1610 family)
MTEPVPAGSEVSAGSYVCTRCNYRLEVRSSDRLPPCPGCGNGEWRTRRRHAGVGRGTSPARAVTGGGLDASS